ncbi:hypothetical protein [Nocardioides sp. GY 10127]|uniref:hypothetical protein n=1 Tax=Nocardioides sp. GY 10127 TaxID=2569762 RepID=UPI0010A8B470|nr:hypothetical protein [Nocardioides sp. GY 10127]TIC79281.1 hypothetical protein E8D37_16890 [Nocardioides sp. GY 10127]
MDFADAVWAAVDRLLTPGPEGGADDGLTDARLAEAMGQPLPVLRAVLTAGDDRFEVVTAKGKQPWVVRRA